MAKNTGKSSEHEWERAHQKLGKRAFFHRFVDASEIKGRTGMVAVSAQAQPSDYILVLDGMTSFCEVKSTQNPTSFPFSILRTKQSAMAKMILAAGGTYNVYVHSLVLGRWFIIPYPVIEAIRETGKSSIPWADLEPREWRA